MNDTVSMTIWSIAPVMAVVGFFLSLVRSRQRSWLRRILGGLCVAVAVGMAMVVIPFAWVLRDGLDTGMVVSEGGTAIAYFLFLYIIALVPVGALALAAWVLLRTPHKNEDHAAS